MQGHQRNLSRYEPLSARVLGVSRDDVVTLKYWARHINITFPLLSNISGYFGDYFGVVRKGEFPFERRTIILDREGIVRYARDGSPDFEEIVGFLKKMNEQDKKP